MVADGQKKFLANTDRRLKALFALIRGANGPFERALQTRGSSLSHGI